MTTPDLGISLPATARWKKHLRSTDSRFSVLENNNIRRLITTHDASKFMNFSFTPGLSTPTVSRNENLREISLQLVTLKKKHDFNKSLNSRHQKLLDKDSKFIEKFKDVEIKTLNTTGNLEKTLKRLESSYTETVRQQDEALEARKVYRHILNRMKIAQIKRDERNLEYNQSIRVSELTLQDEEYKSRKAKEVAIQTKAALNMLTDYVSLETKEKLAKVVMMKKEAEQQVQNSLDRELRHKRQAEIAEAAADDDRNMRAMQMREGLILHRLVYFLLDIKLKRSQQRFAVIDDAFKKIKIQYGFVDPSEMIGKILTKEQTYLDLLGSVNYNRARIEEQIISIGEVQAKIDGILNIKAQYADPNRYWKEILMKTTKECTGDRMKLMKIRIAYEKVKVWSERMLKKLGVQRNEKELIKLRDFIDRIKSCIEVILKKSDKFSVFMNKDKIDNMKIEEVLKHYVGEEGRRRTFVTVPDMSEIENTKEFTEKDEDADIDKNKSILKL